MVNKSSTVFRCIISPPSRARSRTQLPQVMQIRIGTTVCRRFTASGGKSNAKTTHFYGKCAATATFHRPINSLRSLFVLLRETE